MKCPYCNAEVKKGLNVCPYCDSEIIRPESRADAAKNDAAKRRAEIAKTIIKATVIITVVLIVSGMLLTFGTIALLSHSGLLDGSSASSGSEKNLMIKNGTDLAGSVISDSGDGKISLQFSGREYPDVEIQNPDFLSWQKENGESLRGKDILFSTDENGAILELAVKGPAAFLILEENDGIYTACLGREIVQFSSQSLMQKNMLYEGYFSYPKWEVVSAGPAQHFDGATLYYGAVNSGKRSVQEKVASTGEEVTLYQICFDGNWYYCNQEIYDELEDGDSVFSYTFYNMPPCMTYP